MSNHDQPTDELLLPEIAEPEKGEAADESTPQPETEQRSIEAWGEAKGIWPQLPAAGGRANRHYWKFAAAKTLRRWPDGALVTEADFDEAVAEVVKQEQG